MSFPIQLRFTGKPVSQTTGLYYDYQRWYDPTTGQFITPDPKHGHLSNPQSLNPYVYVLDRPTSLTDPTGLDDCGWNPLSWGGCANNGIQAVSNSWNSLTPAQQAQIYTIGIDAAAVGAIALTVATAGAASPLAVVAIGAAVGASTSTTIYTVSQGDRATIAGAAGATVTGAIAGAVGGGAGVASGAIGGLYGTFAGMGIAGIGSVGSDVAGKYLTSSLGGSKFSVSGGDLLRDFSVGALTFGMGSKLGNVGQNYVAGNVIAKNLGEPAISAYFAGGAYNVESNGINALIGAGTELLGDSLNYLFPSS